jgi:transposase
MSKPLVSDELWSLIGPLLPPERPKPKGGRPRVPDRAALTGILFVLRSGIPWELLPQEMGCGSGVTCWRRLREWQQAGVWTRFHGTLLDRLGRADRLDWSRANLDSRLVAAKRGPSHRPEPDGSRAARLETARAQRPPGHPTGRRPERGQLRGLAHVGPDARYRAAD